MEATFLPSLTPCEAGAKEYASLILFVLAVLVPRGEKTHLHPRGRNGIVRSFKIQVNHKEGLNHFVGF